MIIQGIGDDASILLVNDTGIIIKTIECGKVVSHANDGTSSEFDSHSAPLDAWHVQYEPDSDGRPSEIEQSLQSAYVIANQEQVITTWKED